MLSSRGNWWAGLTPVTSADGIRPSVEPDAVWTRIALNERLPDVVSLRFRMRNARLYSFRSARVESCRDEERASET